MTACDSSLLKSSSFYKEITGLPVLNSLEDLYSSAKGSSRILNTGLAVVEYSVSNLLEKVFTGSSLAARVDIMAGEGVSKLKERYPALQTSPEEIRDHTSLTVQKTVRSVMKTGPGQMLIHGLDWALYTSEGILKRVRPRDKSPRKRKITRSAMQKQMHLNKEHSYASEDSGACEAEGDSIKAHKSQQTMLTSKSKKQDDASLIQRAYSMGIVFPLEVLVKVLKSVRRYAGGRRSKPSVKPLTPEKKIEIGSRRKISPRKKVHASILSKIKQRTYMLLGYKNVHEINLGKDMLAASPDRGEAEKKRKHDEILTDEGSETEEDMENFDFENYESEEDPDYEPDSAEESEDSELEDDDAESDIETEVIKTEAKSGLEFVQLKEKPKEVKHVTIEGTDKRAQEIGTPVDKGEDISLKPQWQKEDMSQKRKSLDGETKIPKQ